MSSDNPKDSAGERVTWKPKPKGRRDVRRPKVRTGRESPARKARQ
jgi:hypothetical protein